jgi:hypothetical protein
MRTVFALFKKYFCYTYLSVKGQEPVLSAAEYSVGGQAEVLYG